MANYNIFGYDPNEPLAYIATAFFGLCFIAVFAINIKYRSWFMMVIPIASLMEMVGFALRPSSTTTLSKYIVSVLCVLLAPTVFAMADYAMVSKIMIKTGINPPFFKPKVVRWVFLAGDILSFLIQSGGGGLSASDNRETSRTGSKILLAGLCIALIVFVFFLFCTIYVHIRLAKKENKERGLYVMLYILYIDIILLIIRSVYRVAEYANLEYHNSISTNETLFYTLDGLEMALLNVLWIPFHPGFWNMLVVEDSETEMVEKD